VVDGRGRLACWLAGWWQCRPTWSRRLACRDRGWEWLITWGYPLDIVVGPLSRKGVRYLLGFRAGSDNVPYVYGVSLTQSITYRNTSLQLVQGFGKAFAEFVGADVGECTWATRLHAIDGLPLRVVPEQRFNGASRAGQQPQVETSAVLGAVHQLTRILLRVQRGLVGRALGPAVGVGAAVAFLELTHGAAWASSWPVLIWCHVLMVRLFEHLF